MDAVCNAAATEKGEVPVLSKIERVLDDEVRPRLAADGGDIQIEKFEDGILYVKLLGVCSHCARANETIRFGVTKVLQRHFPEIKEVRNVACC